MATIQRIQHVSVPMPPGREVDARQFYGSALGLEEVAPPEELSRLRLIWFRVGEADVELHCFTEEGLRPNTPAQHLCFQVDDLDAVRERLVQHGVSIEPTIEIHHRPRFFIRDPFGNSIEIVQILGPYRMAHIDGGQGDAAAAARSDSNA
ncbi:MAG: VOC family protein [Chloroflexota bacterium]|nr:VOC family protein [Chloroflexota bacterium]